MQHYLAILDMLSIPGLVLATFAIILTGSLWYSHMLFGKSWRRLSGIRLGDISKSDIRRGYFLSSIVASIQAVLVAIIIEHVHAHWIAVLGTIGLVWMFLLLEMSGRSIWERQPFALFLLHAFRALAALLVAAITYSMSKML